MEIIYKYSIIKEDITLLLCVNYKLQFRASHLIQYSLCFTFSNAIQSEAKSSIVRYSVAAMLKSMMAVLRSITPRLCGNGTNSVCETFIRHPYLIHCSYSQDDQPHYSPVSLTSMFSPSTRASSTAIMGSCVRTSDSLDSRDYITVQKAIAFTSPMYVSVYELKIFSIFSDKNIPSNIIFD